MNINRVNSADFLVEVGEGGSNLEYGYTQLLTGWLQLTFHMANSGYFVTPHGDWIEPAARQLLFASDHVTFVSNHNRIQFLLIIYCYYLFIYISTDTKYYAKACCVETGRNSTAKSAVREPETYL